MSEYQYYEFQAIDRPLGEVDRQLLRDLSTRAQITSTSFTNTYQWGSFKGDTAKLMERWFDLHLYQANWGSRCLIMKVPARLVDRHRLAVFVGEVDDVTQRIVGENLILTVAREEVEADDEGDDGAGRLAALAPLRTDVLAGDLRMFYLIWLMAVEAETFEADEPEPLPGIGPLSGPLAAFADFFGIDADLVQAAGERGDTPHRRAATAEAARHVIAALPDEDRTGLLLRVLAGDLHVAAELRAMVGARSDADAGSSSVPPRTVGALRARAAALRLARERALAEKAAVDRRRQEEAEAQARTARIEALRRRGDSVWREVEGEIERRNAAGYDKAVALLSDLRALAEHQGTHDAFRLRLKAIRERHARKGRFIEALAALG